MSVCKRCHSITQILFRGEWLCPQCRIKSLEDQLTKAEEYLRDYATEAGWIRSGWDKAVEYFAWKAANDKTE